MNFLVIHLSGSHLLFTLLFQGVRKLKGEISRFEQEKADELGRLNEYVASETKKLKYVNFMQICELYAYM